MSLSWTEEQMTWNEKCTASFGKKPCVASASVAVLRNGWVDRALMVGWRGLKIARYDGLQESLNRCRLLRARDSLRRRLQKRGRTQLRVWGVSETPPGAVRRLLGLFRHGG